MSAVQQPDRSFLRTRWSAIGAAVAVTLGAGGIGIAQATVTSGDKPVTVTVEPERILDTRIDLGLAGPFVSSTPRNVQVTGPVTVATEAGTAIRTVVPAGASAVLVNVTVVSPTAQGFLTLRPAGVSGEPTTSTVNFLQGTIEPNAATVDLTADGKLQVWVFMPPAGAVADVLIDVVGYTVDHTHDDRYYTKPQVESSIAAAVAPKANSSSVYSKSEVDALLPPTEETLTLAGWDFHGANDNLMEYRSGGCGFNDTGGELRGSAQIPVGATITGMTATVLDTSASNAELELILFDGNSYVPVAQLTSSGTPGMVDGLTATVTPQTVAPTGHVIMYFGPTTSDTLQLCGVQITYDLP